MVGRGEERYIRRRHRAVQLLGAAALGCATLAALTLRPHVNTRTRVESSVARSYWGPGAPAWWSRFPVAAGAKRRLQAKALAFERQQRLRDARAPAGLGQEEEEEQQQQQRTPALLGNGTRTGESGNGKATDKKPSAARLADSWLHARRSSGTAGHWEWIPASSSQHALGLYYSDRDTMPFRNGIYIHQHAWDTDGLRKQWDTGNSARSYVCLEPRAWCVIQVFPHYFYGPTFT